MESTSNKTIIAGFYREVVRERKSELIPNYVHENYIQHSPMGRDGRQGLFEMVEFLKQLPPVPENEPSPIIHLIEQDDLVVAHLDLHFMGKHIKVIELFKVKDLKAAEHWDVTEELTNATQSFIITPDNIHANSRLEYLKHLYDMLNITIHHIITDGDYIAIHAEVKENSSSTALFDIYQFEGDKIAGHWGVKQAVPKKMSQNNGMF